MADLPQINFTSINLFEAHYHIKDREFYINTITDIWHKKDAPYIEDFTITMEVVYTIPQITKKYAKSIKPPDTYYSLLLWYDKNKAVMLHDNTSWVDGSYFKFFTIDKVVTTKPINRKQNILEYMNKSRVVFDSRETQQQFDNLKEYLYHVLNEVCKYE